MAISTSTAKVNDGKRFITPRCRALDSDFPAFGIGAGVFENATRAERPRNDPGGGTIVLGWTSARVARSRGAP